MLLLSAVLMSTASFAWFSMNKDVTADGMEVTAKSDSLSLVIKTGSGQTISATDTAETASAGWTNITLLPVTPAAALTATNIETNASWQYGYSDSESSGTVSTAGYSKVADDATLLGTGNYVMKQTFTIGLQNSTNGVASASNLKLTGVSLTENKGITVVVVGVAADGSTKKITAEHAANISDGNEVLVETIQKGSPVTVDVYVFIDGDDENVKTQNIANLTGSVELTFAVD